MLAHMAMLAQIVVQTDRHPYHTQVLFLWLSLGPIAVIIALLILVQVWRMRRNRGKSRHTIR